MIIIFIHYHNMIFEKYEAILPSSTDRCMDLFSRLMASLLSSDGGKP